MSIKFIFLPPAVELWVYLDYFQATNLQARSAKELKYVTMYFKVIEGVFHYLKLWPYPAYNIMGCKFI